MSTRKPLAIILAAGMGSRLGRPHPKPLTPLNDGETILRRQLRMLKGAGLEVLVVVGFKMDLIMEAAPDVSFVYNPDYDTTNTARSLSRALQQVHDRDVLWMNGDVVFHPRVLDGVLATEGSIVAVNTERVGEEEVKYITNEAGYITEISKQVKNAEGEALGINRIESGHLEQFKQCLAEVGAQDYFERGMEVLIQQEGDVFRPHSVGNDLCIEVDFEADLERAVKALDALT
ncbi:MAG: phosphocholine cytidylyltransferase family protein [Gammaproteobacteria bacterium]|nr:phosphocholine cytidylyltransferase family protein [Gammaproteobacteria bacterium]